MVELFLPFHEDIPKWLGYPKECNGLALWWGRSKFMLWDGHCLKASSTNLGWRQIECSARFKNVLDSLEYHHDLGITQQANDGQNAIFIDCLDRKFYYAPINPILDVVREYNASNIHEGENGQKLRNSIEIFKRWGVADENLKELAADLADSGVSPDVEMSHFRSLNQWLKSV